MNDPVNVLDHGYAKLIDVWGSDERIIESARMSTDKEFLGWGTPEAPGDEKLLKYLYDHKHSTPFEFGGMTVETQAPILVYREWHRHRTQSYSELSARYVAMPNLNYIPSIERLMIGSNGGNKQAGTIKGANVLTVEEAERFRQDLADQYAAAERCYQNALHCGVPKELARAIIPVGRYSRMRASANLRNWLAFLTLRMDSNAQWEIRQYANIVASMIEVNFPRTYELFASGR